jgi:tyrosyl-tRNA synthetase
MPTLTTPDKVNLILRNLSEYLGPKDSEQVLTKIVDSGNFRVYWGTAPTGRIHIGYLIPMMKIADLLRAGCEVTILLADIHAMLDKMKSTPDQLESRTAYYKLMIQGILSILGIDLANANLKFVTGREFQLTPEYTFDILQHSAHVTTHNAQRAGTEVVKQTDQVYVTDLLYPIMQVLDEKHLNVHCQLGGIDQRHIFVLSREMKHLKKKALFHLMNPLLPALTSTEPTKENTKMSSSSGIKIDLLCGKKAIVKLVNSVYCLTGAVEKNPLLDLVKILVFPLLEYTLTPFQICRKDEYGGNISYMTFHDLETDFVKENLHPQDLKDGVATFLVDLLKPLRDTFDIKENNVLLKSYI